MDEKMKELKTEGKELAPEELEEVSGGLGKGTWRCLTCRKYVHDSTEAQWHRGLKHNISVWTGEETDL